MNGAPESGPPPAPGTLRVLRLLLALSVRRWLNRVFANLNRGRPAKDGARRPTPGKRVGGTTALIFVGLLLLLQSVRAASSVVGHATAQLLSRSPTTLSAKAYRCVERAAKKPAKGPARREAELSRLRECLTRALPAEDDARDRVDEITRVYQARGKKAFHRAPDTTFILGPSPRLWAPKSHLPDLARVLAGLTALLGAAAVASSLGSAKDDLGRVEWTMEWLYQMPVPTRAIHLAKLIERAIVHPILWLVGMPSWFVFGWCAGLGWWALPLALLLALQVGLVSGSLHLLIETWLRLRFSPARVKNVQALFSMSATILLFGMVWVGASVEVPEEAIDALAQTPLAAAWNPFSVGVLIVTGVPHRAAAIAAALAFTLVIPGVAVAACDRLVAPGLLVAGNVYQGSRRAPAASSPAPRRGLLAGIAAKDARLLVRDKNLLMQTLLVPFLVFGLQLAINPRMLADILGNFRHAASVGFFAGTYGFAFSAFNVLNFEGRALWLLYTFPRPLHRVLLDKVLLWSACGLVFTGALLIAGFALGPAAATMPIDALTALVGTLLYAFIAAGLGAMGTDPFATTQAQKANPLFVYLYLFLIGLYANALYADSLWIKAVQLVLSALLAIALWQKVRDRIPYLLDPTEAPPPSIDVSDGLVAVLAFFVLQGLIAAAAVQAPGVSISTALVVAFALAGFLVSAAALVIFWRTRVEGLFASLGFVRRAGEGRPVYLALPLGVLAGLGAAAFALCYLFALDRIGPLRALRDDADAPAVPAISRGALFGVAVVAAPIFEELIFRGLIFRGLRRSWGFLPAALGAAAIFAICHPPLAVVPVFGLGFAAALAFEKTGLLLAPIAAHVVYNGIVLLLSNR